MPRFFFHIFDDVVVRDDEGIELVDLEAARRTALTGIREMMCDQLKRGRINLTHRVEVQDEAGSTVLDIRFGEAVRIET